MNIAKLKATVDENCNISDAKFWSSYSVCELLLRLRQHFMWLHGVKPWERVDRRILGRFIEEREALWHELEHRDFLNLEIEGNSYSPFDSQGINSVISEQGYCYGSGYSRGMKPSFFLAELSALEKTNGFTVYFAEKELSRDLFTSPAMLRGREIFIRLETMREFIWDRLTHSSHTKPREEFLREHNLINLSGGELWDGLMEACRREAEVFIRHEISESRIFTREIKDILHRYSSTPAENVLRALIDVVADLSPEGTLDFIISNRKRSSLALYFINLSGIRRSLLCGLRRYYTEWKALEQFRQEKYHRLKEVLAEVVGLLSSHQDYPTAREEFAEYIFHSLGLNL